MQTCLSKVFTASDELSGTPLVLDEWLPLDLTNLDSVTVQFIGGETVRAIMEEGGVPGAVLDEGGGAWLEE